MSTEQRRMSVLPETIAKAITNRTSVTENAERKKGMYADQMFAAGFRSGHCINPKTQNSAESLSTPECFEQIRQATILGFSEKVRKLLLADIDTLTPEEKAERKRWQQRVSPNIRDLHNALELREIEAGEKPPKVKVKKPKSLEDKIIAQLVTLAQSAQKAEAPSFDVVGFIQALGNTAETIGIDAGIRFHLELNGNQD